MKQTLLELAAVALMIAAVALMIAAALTLCSGVAVVVTEMVR